MTRIATLTPPSLPTTRDAVDAVYSPDMDKAAAASSSIIDALAIVNRAGPRCGATKVVAIDGPSGAGKTTFGTVLSERLPNSQVLHMDELYKGWAGLQEAIVNLHDHVLSPIARGNPASYQRWNWELSRYADWQVLPHTDLLLVEGVGSGARPGAELESVLIWVEADQDVRFRRGIERDGESYLPHWQRWAAQEEAHFALDGTRDRADLIMSTTTVTDCNTQGRSS
jgi:uridine kinase